MTLFDHAFGLSAVVLGLGLAEMALRLQQLMAAGKRVKWAVEPILLAAIVFQIIVVLWLGAWRDHEMKSITLGAVELNVLAILAPFIVAAGIFPKATDSGTIDLHSHYDRSRGFLFGTLAIGLMINWATQVMRIAPTLHGAGDWLRFIPLSIPYYGLIPYVLMTFIRTRWLNIAALAFVLLWFGSRVVGFTLTA